MPCAEPKKEDDNTVNKKLKQIAERMQRRGLCYIIKAFLTRIACSATSIYSMQVNFSMRFTTKFSVLTSNPAIPGANWIGYK
jgi:hypothetical protein